MGERIRFSEVELKEASPQAFRDCITRWNVFERECRVWWDRSLIHSDVTGFLDLRWREFVQGLNRYPNQSTDNWLDVEPEKFEEFILWVADVMERETNSGGSAVERLIITIRKMELRWIR